MAKISVECPSCTNFSTGQDLEPSLVCYPPKPTSNAFLGATGSWEGAELMRRHPRLAPIQLLQEIKPGMESAEPSLCWWLHCPLISLWSTALFGISVAALAQGSGPSLAGSGHHQTIVILLLSSSTIWDSFPALGVFLWDIPLPTPR